MVAEKTPSKGRLLSAQATCSPGAVAVALALAAPVANAGGVAHLVHSLAEGSAASATAIQSVFNCADSGPGSLRTAIANANSGDTIDLTQLSCSHISLYNPLDIQQTNLSINGPGRDALEISASQIYANRFPAIRHFGAGTLAIRGVLIDFAGHEKAGGCIVSYAGSILLADAGVANCIVGLNYSRPNLVGAGGAIYAHSDVTLQNSDVSHSEAHSLFSGTRIAGGGIFAGHDLTVQGSSIGYNVIYATDAAAYGGGLAAKNNVTIISSTISGNVAEEFNPGSGAAFAGAVDILDYFGTATASITQSTISHNISKDRVGGVLSAAPLHLHNSTIAFNTSVNLSHNGVPYAAGLFVYSGAADLQSSIIANNTGSGNLYDFSLYKATVSGANNLIMGTNVVLSGTKTGDPLLATLGTNGGPTMTHALGNGSPAIGNGNNAQNFVFDQRGSGFARTFAHKTDIGAFQSGDSIFNDGFAPSL